MTSGLHEEVASGVTFVAAWICTLSIFAVPYGILIPVMFRFQFSDPQHLHERGWLMAPSIIFLIVWTIGGAIALGVVADET